MEYKDPGRYTPIIYLLYSWGSGFGVPSSVLLSMLFLVVWAPLGAPVLGRVRVASNLIAIGGDQVA